MPLVVGLFAIVCAALPWSGAQVLGRCLGRLAWSSSPRERRRILEHLGIAYPSWTQEQRLSVGRECLRQLGMSIAELLHLHIRSRSTVEKHLRIEGGDEFRALRNSGKPILIVTGHCGNWELIAAACRRLDVPLVAVARDLQTPFLHQLIVRIRERYECKTLVRGGGSSASLLLRALRGSGVLAMLIDQDIDVEGVFVPFFDRPAFTPVGAAKLARRLHAVVVPTFSERDQDGSHVVRFEPPLNLPQDLEASTALMTKRIELQIRRKPEQWVWLHRRWLRRPPQEQINGSGGS